MITNAGTSSHSHSSAELLQLKLKPSLRSYTCSPWFPTPHRQMVQNFRLWQPTSNGKTKEICTYNPSKYETTRWTWSTKFPTLLPGKSTTIFTQMDSTSDTYLPMARPRTIPMLSVFYRRPPLQSIKIKLISITTSLNSDSLVGSQQNHQIHPSTMQVHPH